MTGSAYDQIPDHVRRIIDRDGQTEFTPPSFERWLGRLHMFRTIASMGAFIAVWLVSFSNGQTWDGATLRAIAAALVFHFFAWATGLYLFGELYDAEVKRARRDLELRERERANRIEEYYRERLNAMAAANEGDSVSPVPGGVVPSVTNIGSTRAPSSPSYGGEQRLAA